MPGQRDTIRLMSQCLAPSLERAWLMQQDERILRAHVTRADAELTVKVGH